MEFWSLQPFLQDRLLEVGWQGQKRTIKTCPKQKQEELQSCSLWKENHIHRKTDKMKRQRALYQMKEQDKTPEKQLNEVEIGNLPEKIQNNDSEDDPGPRKKNGGKD